MLLLATLVSVGIKLEGELSFKHALGWFFIIGGFLGILWVAGVFPRKHSGHKKLQRRCEDLIVQWLELAELYQNSPKESGQPATLQEPMSPAWVGSQMQIFPNRVGVLQGMTTALRSELRGASVSVEEWDSRISLPRLIEALRRYSTQL